MAGCVLCRIETDLDRHPLLYGFIDNPGKNFGGGAKKAAHAVAVPSSRPGFRFTRFNQDYSYHVLGILITAIMTSSFVFHKLHIIQRYVTCKHLLTISRDHYMLWWGRRVFGAFTSGRL
jgi:hypothetical protein